MSWIVAVLTSQFLWGVVLGVALSIVTARVSVHFQNDEHRRRVRTFSADLVRNLQDYARAMDEHRERNNVIYYDFIALIENEVGIWGRNREHTILLDDHHTKRLLRDYFAKTAKLVVELKFHLQNMETSLNQANAQSLPTETQRLHNEADEHLKKAQERATRLTGHILQSIPESRLAKLSQ